MGNAAAAGVGGRGLYTEEDVTGTGRSVFGGAAEVFSEAGAAAEAAAAGGGGGGG